MTTLKEVAFRLATTIGRYHDWRPEERLTRQTDVVGFRGDVPAMAGREPNQRRLVLENPPPLITQARRVLYTPKGMAWIDGSLERRFSFEEIGLRQIADSPGRPGRRYAEASVLQSQTPRTYGDWVSEHLASLSLATVEQRIVEPLLLPAWWYAKPYVRRDLERLRVRAEPVASTARIDDAQVINKTRFAHYWVRREVDAILAAMRIERRPCRPGSALYLSRKGERGEGPQRTLNNVVTERAMEEAGVKVVRTALVGLDDYLRLADDAETVFADHGSASYNVMHWQTRRFVEFFAPTYWESAFLFLTDCLGIRDYHLWRIDPDATVARLASRIAALRAEPCRGGATPERG